jgi:hypothetical protein
VVEALAVLVRAGCVTGVLTRTPKVRDTEAPTVRVPMRREQVEPAAGPGEQDQPGELEAESKVEPEGTVSLRVTLEAEKVPRLRTARV